MPSIFVFNQNNSGGYCIVDNDIAEVVAIVANDEDYANIYAEELGMFDLPYCKCCGRRFDNSPYEYNYDVYGISAREISSWGDTFRGHYNGTVYTNADSFVAAVLEFAAY